MLKINDEEYKIISKNVELKNSTQNKIKGYSLLVSINIEKNNIKGYIKFYVDFIKEKNISYYENKTYHELPTELSSKISILEIFDTLNFIDFIDSEVQLEFGDIKNNKIKMKLNINDKLIKVNLDDFMNII